MQDNFTTFDRANEYVMNKDVTINHYIKYMLARTQSMFSYSGLPDTLPASKLEMMLQTKGYCFITKEDGKLYAFTGSLTGEPDVYEDYTQINIVNTALKLSKTYDLENDGVLMNNDTLRLGLLPILNKYGALLSENMITIHTVDTILRMVCMISASDDRTYTGAEKFISDIEKGKISAIGESAFFEGIKLHSVANTQNYMTQFMELEQYLKASCFNEIGLNANYNLKKEHIGSGESSLNDDMLLPLVDNMIKERQIAIDKINEMFGTEITIDYASSWKVTHQENEKQMALAEAIIDQSATGEADISVENHQGIHDVNTPTVFLNNESGEQNEPTEPEEQTDSAEPVELNEESTDTTGEIEHTRSDDAEQTETERTDDTPEEENDNDTVTESDTPEQEESEEDDERNKD